MKTSATSFANSKSSMKSKSIGTFKSKLAEDQMEAVINEIKNRYTEQKIQAMSQDDLQKEVMEEIIRRKQ
jgi:hypothetical protein